MASAITLIVLVGILIVVGLAIGIVRDEAQWVLSVLLAFLMIPAIIDLTDGPRDKDVIEGRAVYVETTHILNGDTTHTYELKWKRDLEEKK